MSDEDQQFEQDDNFEIAFYEGILEHQPAFVEALFALGDLYTKKGRFKDGLMVDLQLESLRPNAPIILYNLSCSFSLLEQTDNALATIKRAIDCGYNDFQHLMQDDDMDNLRRDVRFQKYFSTVKRKMETQAPNHQSP